MLLSLQKPQPATVYVAIGSNEAVETNIQAALTALSDLESIHNIKISPTFESNAVGFDGAAFWNLVISFNTDLDRRALITELKRIENQQGRIRDKRCVIKSLDLDLLHHSVDQPEHIHHDVYECLYVYKPLNILINQSKQGKPTLDCDLNNNAINVQMTKHSQLFKYPNITLNKVDLCWKL